MDFGILPVGRFTTGPTGILPVRRVGARPPDPAVHPTPAAHDSHPADHPLFTEVERDLDRLAAPPVDGARHELAVRHQLDIRSRNRTSRRERQAHHQAGKRNQDWLWHWIYFIKNHASGSVRSSARGGGQSGGFIGERASCPFSADTKARSPALPLPRTGKMPVPL